MTVAPHLKIWQPDTRQPRGPSLWEWLAMVVAVLAVTAFCAAVDSYGAETSQQRSTVRIRQQVCTPQGCKIASWSGTLIGGLKDQRFAVLTCAHGYAELEPVAIEVQAGEWIEGDIVALDLQSDLGLIAFKHPAWLPCVNIADKSASAGTVITLRGFPHGDRYRERTSRVLRTSERHAVADATFIPGESGGTVLANNAVVGVIQGTDRIIVDGRVSPEVLTPGFPNGHFIPQPVIRQFVLTAAGELPVIERPAKDQPQAFRRRDSPPEEPIPDLGRATPPEPKPAPGASEGEAPAKDPEAVDWSLAKLVVLVPRQESLDKVDAIVRAVEQLSAHESGPGKSVRRWINEQTNGQADIEVVYERIEPTKYREIVTVSGLRVGKYAGIVALVRKQGGGLLDPLKAIAARIGQRVAERKLPDIPLEVLLQRTAAAEFDDIIAALEKSELAASVDETDGQNWSTWIFASLFPCLRGVRQAIQHWRGLKT